MNNNILQWRVVNTKARNCKELQGIQFSNWLYWHLPWLAGLPSLLYQKKWFFKILTLLFGNALSVLFTYEIKYFKWMNTSVNAASMSASIFKFSSWQLLKTDKTCLRRQRVLYILAGRFMNSCNACVHAYIGGCTDVYVCVYMQMS